MGKTRSVAQPTKSDPKLYASNAKLTDLFTLKSLNNGPGQASRDCIWLGMPHSTAFEFPMYAEVEPTPLCEETLFSMAYGKPTVPSDYYYARIWEAEDGGPWLLTLNYQFIIGSRQMCRVPIPQILEFFGMSLPPVAQGESNA